MVGIDTAIGPGLMEAMRQQMLKDDLNLERDRFIRVISHSPQQPSANIPVVKPVNKKVLLLVRSK